MLRFRRWVSGLLLLPAFGTHPLVANAPEASSLEQAIARAESHLQKGEPAAAEREYRAALFEGWLLRAALLRLEKRLPAAKDAVARAATLAPEDRAGRRSLAASQLQVGDTAAAIAILAPLAAEDVRDAETRRLLAKAQAADGRIDQAVRTLDEASALAADQAELAFLLATEYLWLKRPESAERLFAQVARARPIPQTHVLIGRAYRDAGEYDRAAAALRAALAQDPSVRRAHYYLGMVLLADARVGPERMQQAIAEFREELATAPDDPLANDQLGTALLDAGRPAQALAPLQAAVRVDPRFTYVLHLGRAQLGLDQARDAVETLRRALALAGEQGAGESDLEKIHYQLGLALRKAGAAPEGAIHLGESRRLAGTAAARPAESAPDASPLADMTRARREELLRRVTAALARASFNLGVLAAQAGGADGFARAASSFEEAAALDPEFPQLQRALGVACFNARRFDCAVSALERALGRAPGDAGVTRMLALSLVNTQDWPRAADLLGDDPERAQDGSLQLAYGMALARSGRAAEAVAPLEAAARLAPRQADVRLELAQAYETLGRSEQARAELEAYRRLQDQDPGSLR